MFIYYVLTNYFKMRPSLGSCAIPVEYLTTKKGICVKEQSAI